MARPVTITDEQIVAAARAVFAREGAAATTKGIAREAGISEGTIFNRFPTKEALLQAAVRPPDVPGWVRTMDDLRGQGDMRGNLCRLAREMIDFVRDRLPLLTVLWSCRLELPPESPDSPAPALRDQRRLAGFLRDEIGAGRLRACDTEAVAQVLFGACVSYVIDRRDSLSAITEEAVASYAMGLIDTIWPGISPEPTS